MDPDAPLAHLQHHRPAVAAVMRDKTGMPRASDRELKAARGAGLIKFVGWPSGHWQLTPLGADLMTDY
ncbi:hypothetical protein D2T31_00455 [Sinirhodobacter populi]|uniref:Uncharacterized protein n=1 Tax=Paenirhodobacter populi TaxID=2306993 RepID=A0A443KID9_9RHOB|nr:hypothetical protein D2T31_00455 [Sinirhodobacter populi]